MVDQKLRECPASLGKLPKNITSPPPASLVSREWILVPASQGSPAIILTTQADKTTVFWRRMAWKIIDRILLPAAFFLIAFVGALTLWQLLLGHRSAEIQSVTNEQVSFVK